MLQPPPVRRLVPCLDPAAGALPVSYPIPLPGQPVDVGCGLMQPQFVAGEWSVSLVHSVLMSFIVEFFFF